jgi:hypothetical protein
MREGSRSPSTEYEFDDGAEMSPVRQREESQGDGEKSLFVPEESPVRQEKRGGSQDEEGLFVPEGDGVDMAAALAWEEDEDEGGGEGVWSTVHLGELENLARSWGRDWEIIERLEEYTSIISIFPLVRKQGLMDFTYSYTCFTILSDEMRTSAIPLLQHNIRYHEPCLPSPINSYIAFPPIKPRG